MYVRTKGAPRKLVTNPFKKQYDTRNTCVSGEQCVFMALMFVRHIRGVKDSSSLTKC